MSVSPLTCPYCNAQVAPPADGRRLSCPRCGEMITLHHAPAEVGGNEPGRSLPSPTVSTPQGDRSRRSNRLVAAIVLSGMVLMAGAGLALALLTIDARRSHDRSLPRRIRRPHQLFTNPEPEPGELVAPARLAALGYFPPETNLLAGVHIADLLSSPAGKELRGQVLHLGKVELRLDSVRAWTGLEPDDIDHVVLGVILREGDELDVTPPAHLVIRTRQPYDSAQVRAALQAGRGREEKAPGGEKRTLYAVKLPKLPLPALLWLADAHTLVFGLFSKLEGVPARPHEGVTQLSEQVQTALLRRVASGSALWAVGHSADWKKTWLPVLLEGVKGVPVLGRLDQVRTFAVWVLPDRPVKLFAAFRCADEQKALRIEAEELAPRALASPAAFKYGRDGEWLDVQVRVEGGK